MVTPEQIQSKDSVLRLDDQINRIQLAASYLRSLAVALEGQESIEPLTLRLKAHASELARLATEMAERTGRVLPAEIDTTASLETALTEEDPDGIFKVWVHLEFYDVRKGRYQDLGDHAVEPKCAGAFTSLRQAMEQVHSLQGRFGGITLFEHDMDELVRADEIQKELLGENSDAVSETEPVQPAQLTGDQDSDCITSKAEGTPEDEEEEPRAKIESISPSEEEV